MKIRFINLFKLFPCEFKFFYKSYKSKKLKVILR